MKDSSKKFNTKNYFDFGLYKESLRQLSLVAFICFILINVISILIPVSSFISEMSSLAIGETYVYEYAEDGTMSQVTNITNNIIKIDCDATEMCWYLFVIFMIVAPLLTLIAFNFLTKRNACDYFHAFPQKRQCIFITYIASVLTWLLIITFGSASITSITYICCNRYLNFTHFSLWAMSFSIFICSFLVVVSVAIACSITGTIFTNIVTSLLILFFPRLLIYLTVTCLTSASSILVTNKLMPILDPTSNLIIAGIFDIDESFFSPVSIIYTIVLAIIYFVIGLWLFTKRTSETAGNSAINRLLQCVFRLCIGLPLSFIVIYGVFELIVSNDWENLYPEDIFYVFVIELICIIAMLLFELLSTKKFRNVLKSLPSILLFFAVQIVILVASLTLYTIEINYSPSADKIDYIIPGSISNSEDYYSAKLSGCKISNDEINEIISYSLEKTLKNHKERTRTHYDSKERVDYYGDQSVIVGIKSGLTVKYRKIRMTSTDYERYISLLIESAEVMKLYDTLPKFNNSTMDIWGNHLGPNDVESIYNSLREEVAAMDAVDWYNCLYKDSHAITLTLSAYVNNQYTYTTIPLCEQTPKTLMLYMNTVNKTANEAGYLKQLPYELDKYSGSAFFDNSYGQVSHFDSSFSYEEMNVHYWDIIYYYNDHEEIEEYAENVKGLFTEVCNKGYEEITSIDAKKGYTLVNLYFYSYDADIDFQYFVYVEDTVLEKYGYIQNTEELEDEEY